MSNTVPLTPNDYFPSTGFSSCGVALATPEPNQRTQEPGVFTPSATASASTKFSEQDELNKLFEEKREFPRVPFRGRAKAVVFPSGDNVGTDTIEDSEVITSDLSRGGVSILHRTQLVPGQQLMLMLNESMQLAEVRWCCRVWDGLFAAGCRFMTETRECDVEQQLAAIDVVISNEELWWDVKE